MSGMRRRGAEAEAAYDGQDDYLVLSTQAWAGEALSQAVPSGALGGRAGPEERHNAHACCTAPQARQRIPLRLWLRGRGTSTPRCSYAEGDTSLPFARRSVDASRSKGTSGGGRLRDLPGRRFPNSPLLFT